MAYEDNMAILDHRIPIHRLLPRAMLAAALAVASVTSVQADVYTNEHGERIECKQEAVTKEGHSVAAPLAGAVIGGVVGNQFGSGRGRDAMTAAGAVGGAVAGKKIDENRTQNGTTYREVCRKIG